MTSHLYRRKTDIPDSNMKATSDSDSSSRSITSPPTSIPSLEGRGSSASSAQSEQLFEYDYRASADTYCTTVASFDDYEDDEPEYDDYDYNQKTPRSEATPATPAEFAALFPSIRRLQVKHDDSSSDGDMNIRVDTSINDRYGTPRHLTLFHLRMYDLEKREFSLRRYGRDCGREVAHTHTKVEKQNTPRRPAIQRSVSRAFHSFRGKADQEKQMTLNRQDSGYGSEDEDDVFQDKPQPAEETKSANTVTLEFSNYAHVQLTRKGTKMSRKYDFEYWGKNYSWKRLIRRLPATGEEEVSYQLVNNANNNIVAVILPDPISPLSGPQNEHGEFVPQCSFYMKDSPSDPIGGPSDVAE